MDIPADIDPDAVSLAKLMVYKRRDPGDAFNQTLQVYELTGPNHSVPKSRYGNVLSCSWVKEKSHKLPCL